LTFYYSKGNGKAKLISCAIEPSNPANKQLKHGRAVNN